MSPTLRTATPADASTIAGLTRELGYPAETAAIASRLARLLARDDQLVLVAEHPPGDVVGWLQASTNEPLESGFRAEIVGLVVSDRARRQGVGRQLVARAEQWAAARGAPAIVVRSNLKRVESHAFYPALGYTSTKNQAVYRKALCGIKSAPG